MKKGFPTEKSIINASKGKSHLITFNNLQKEIKKKHHSCQKKTNIIGYITKIKYSPKL